MRQIRTSGSMSGDGKRGDGLAATALILDSTFARNDMAPPFSVPPLNDVAPPFSVPPTIDTLLAILATRDRIVIHEFAQPRPSFLLAPHNGTVIPSVARNLALKE
jgi:hypothetical protein